MSEVEFWSVLGRKEALRYPYSPQRNIFSRFDDPYHRDIPRLLESYLCLGKKFVNDSDLEENINIEDVSRAIRVCEDRIKVEDLRSLSASLGGTTTRTSTVIICGNNIVADEAVDWNQLLQAVFIHRISRTKASVYSVTIASGFVDVFAVGPCENVELQQFAIEIMNYLATVLPGRSLSFRFRFQIPSSFFKDSLFMAFILAMQLHGHGKYLKLDNKRLSIYKWKCLDGFKRIHDNWLGTLDLNLGYPFHVPEQNQDDLGELTSLGWDLVDVKGDGHCGFYAFILGLHNNSHTELYNPFYFAENGARADERREIPEEDLELEWQKQALRLRIDLRNHSIHLLRRVYRPGREPTWWYVVGPMSAEDRTLNSDNLYMRGYTIRHYYPECPEELMMIGTWGGFVFASKFRMRVVLIQLRHNHEGVDWTTHIYSSQDNVEPQVLGGIHRLSDDEYRREPTVEFFQNFGVDVDPHFQFLRRVYYDQAAHVPLEENNNETLLSVLKREQQEAKNKPTRASDQSQQASQQSKAAAAAVPVVDSQQHQRDASHEPSPQLIGEPNEAAADVPPVDSQQNQHGASHDPIPQRFDEIQEPCEGEQRQELDHDAVPINEPLPQVDNAEPINEPLPQVDNAEPINEPHVAIAMPQVNDAEIEPFNEPYPQFDNVPLPQRVSQGKILRATQGNTQRKNKRSQSNTRDKVSQQEEPTRRVSRRLQDPDEQYDEAYFDRQYYAQSLRHKTPARMKYDPVLDTFWISFVRGLTFTKAEEVSDVEVYDDILVDQARRNPGVWQGCGVGDPLDGHVPSDLATTVPSPFRQHNNKHCLLLSLANAFRYCNLIDQANVLDTQARVFARYTFETQLKELQALMVNLAPLIGRPKIFGENRWTINQKRRRTKPTELTWDSLFSEIVPHPTIVIPRLADGTASHAFCVVDDLIFDSSFPYAFKLQKESVDWIFNETQVSIFLALRFNKKVSENDNVKKEEWFNRKVTLNWIKPSSMAFIKRKREDWYLPHYIVKK